MLTYLTSAQLTAALISTDETKTLYFQDIAQFPAFLHLTAEEVSKIPVNTALTPMFQSTKRALRLILPGATFSPGLFLPIALQLSPIEMSMWVSGFSNLSVRTVQGIDYSIFDDISSDLFVIMPSNTPLAELNATYTGSHRITPINVLKSLKRVDELFKAITLSNITEIPDPIVSTVTPTPIPIPVSNTFSALGRVWTEAKPIMSNFPVSISTPVSPSAVIGTYTTQAEIDAIETALAAKYPLITYFIQNGRKIDFMGTSSVQWDLTQ